jgi:hypothetical protein
VCAAVDVTDARKKHIAALIKPLRVSLAATST